jgi:hypothetical protein
MTTDKSYTLEVKENEDGETFIELPIEIIESLELNEGDVMQWTDNEDGSFTLTKKKTKLVLVETVSMFRLRYVVEVPEGGKAEWALDTVTMEEAVEFSQKHLGENITSHREITDEEALNLCDEDNGYSRHWPDDKKRQAFITSLKE